jgi:hypothetical protein
MSIADWFRPKWKNSNPGVRLRAVAGLINRALAPDNVSQRLLAQIAEKDEDSQVREAAADGSLACMALYGYSDRQREYAIGRLTNQNVLASIVKSEEKGGLRREAAYRVTEQALLMEFAKMHDDEFASMAAAQRVTDDGVLADIAVHNRSSSVRRAAAERVNDQRLLADIARTDNDPGVRRAAVQRVADQTVLADIAKSDNDVSVCRSAVARVTDPVVRDLLWVEVELPFLTVWRVAAEGAVSAIPVAVAKELIAIATRRPSLLRARWDEIAQKIKHVDRTRHADGDSCGHVDENHHGDNGLGGLTFPPKPTDF